MVEHRGRVPGCVQLPHADGLAQQPHRVVAVGREPQQIGPQGVPRRALGEPQDEVVGLLVDPLADLRPEHLFSSDTEGIAVPRDSRRQQPRRVLLLPQPRGRRFGHVVVGQDALQPLDAGEQVSRVGVDQAVRVAVADDLQVEVVRLPSAGEHRVDVLARLLAAREPVHGVGGESLRAVDRGGVAEVDPFAHVVGGQGHGVLRAQALDAQAAVRRDGRHLPAVAVLHPVATSDRQATSVVAGDHQVAGNRDVAVGEASAATDHAASFVVALLGELVESADQISGRGEHEGVQAVRVVLRPCVQHRARHGDDVADVDPVVVEVVAQRLRPALAQRRGRLPPRPGRRIGGPRPAGTRRAPLRCRAGHRRRRSPTTGGRPR